MRSYFLTLSLVVVVVVLAMFAQALKAQIIRIDLNIDQPNIEDCITGVETNFQAENISVFPNPGTGLFTVAVDKPVNNAPLSISVHNLNGQEIFAEKLLVNCSSVDKKIDLSGFPTGMYFLNIRTEEKYYKAKIILK